MKDTIFVREKSYSVESFSDLHLSTINKLLSDLGNLQYQSDAGYVLKEIMLPDLPVDIIRPSAIGKYIILLNAHELNDVIINVMKIYYGRELKRAIESNNKKHEDQIRANMTELQINENSPRTFHAPGQTPGGVFLSGATPDALFVRTDTVGNKRQQELDEIAALRAENAKLKAQN